MVTDARRLRRRRAVGTPPTVTRGVDCDSEIPELCGPRARRRGRAGRAGSGAQAQFRLLSGRGPSVACSATLGKTTATNEAPRWKAFAGFTQKRLRNSDLSPTAFLTRLTLPAF
ncbi:hypothetical protein SUZIE_132910 [Sciurus carolinensis]|uniref:Uncharacterized protein n=1 Tax=Sciurus carolinensis TaxID=30640 RepID=A0AA41MNW0_SCICA|nr:hypothetical protein [Sciurus carolinensis]